MDTMNATDNPLFLEKIFIEPDLGDQRKSTYKALPAPPKTPKSVMMRYRFSAVFSIAFAVTSFVLTLVIVLAGNEIGTFEGQYLVALNTSKIGQDLIRFEKASTTSANPSATSSTTTNPLGLLNPFPTESPLNLDDPDSLFNGLGNVLEPLTNNLTNAINEGLGSLVNSVVEGVIDNAGIADFYYVYLRKLCSGSLTNDTTGNADGIEVEKCESWDEARNGLASLTARLQSSVVIGQTNVSIPLIAKLASSLDTVSGGLSSARKVVLAFLIISLIGSGLSAFSALPAIIYPHSRLLTYFNIFWPSLAGCFAFLAATILTMLLVGVTSLIGGLGDLVGLEIKQGGKVLLFVWLAWIFVSLPGVYWATIWFVELRKSSYVRRVRRVDEVGSWRGVGKEVWRDLRGSENSLIGYDS